MQALNPFPFTFPCNFSDTMDVVKQSAALCLLRLFRTSQEIIPGGEWTSRIIHLLNDQHMGVVTAATSLIDALVKKNPDEYKGCVSLAVSRLSRVRSVPLLFALVLWLFFKTDCHSQLHGSTGLHILLCTGALALCQTSTPSTKLYASRYFTTKVSF